MANIEKLKTCLTVLGTISALVYFCELLIRGLEGKRLAVVLSLVVLVFFISVVEIGELEEAE